MSPARRPLRRAIALGAVLAGISAHQVLAQIPAHPRSIKFEAASFRTPKPEARLHQFTAGTKGFVERDHLLPLLEVTLAFEVGGQQDPAEMTGLALLTATLLARGGNEKLPPSELDSKLEAMGADLRSFVRGGRAIVRLSTPAWTASEALDVFFDLVTAPRFDQRMLDVIRRTAFDELGRRNENPLDVLEREWTWLVLGRDHPAGRAPTPASLGAISRADLRAFYACFWHPGNLVAAISGDVSDEVLSQIDKRISAWKARSGAGDAGGDCSISGSAGDHPAGTERASAAVSAPGVYVAFHDAPQAKVLIGHALPELPGWTERERFALLVAREILGGGGAISRLNGRLRTAEGLVYRASANVEIDAPGRNEFRLFLETRPDRAWRAIEIALEEVERLRRELVHPRELAVVRESLIGLLRSEFDTAEETVGYLVENALLARPLDYWQSYLEAVRSIDREEVRDAARKYFQPDNFTILVVGPEIALVRTAEGVPMTQDAQPLEVLPRRDPRTFELIPSADARPD